mgnify:CR=1 FL=1
MLRVTRIANVDHATSSRLSTIACSAKFNWTDTDDLTFHRDTAVGVTRTAIVDSHGTASPGPRGHVNRHLQARDIADGDVKGVAALHIAGHLGRVLTRHRPGVHEVDHRAGVVGRLDEAADISIKETWNNQVGRCTESAYRDYRFSRITVIYTEHGIQNWPCHNMEIRIATIQSEVFEHPIQWDISGEIARDIGRIRQIIEV